MYNYATNSCVTTCTLIDRCILDSFLLFPDILWNSVVLPGAMSGAIFWSQLYFCMETLSIVQR